MKTYKNLFQNVCTFRTLNDAYMKARKGKHSRPEVVKFTYYLERELFILEKELKNETYKTGRYRRFIIYEPKKREISALPFRDRVVQHGICAVIEPIFEKQFISDSYACRKNKGTHAGVAKLQKFIQGTGNSYYALKCDISKYFSSINHDVLKKAVRRKISDIRLLNLLDEIIVSASYGKGVPIGNLTSQLFANIYLNQLDEYVKYTLGVKYYLRYMDDFIILHESKEHLHEIKDKIRNFLASLFLTTHPTKTSIFPVSTGVDFLCYRIFVTHRLARKSTVKRFIRNAKGQIRNYEKGFVSYEKMIEFCNSWTAYLSHGNTYLLKNSLYNRYFKNVA